jgi:hypothetical protein
MVSTRSFATPDACWTWSEESVPAAAPRRSPGAIADLATRGPASTPDRVQALAALSEPFSVPTAAVSAVVAVGQSMVSFQDAITATA